MQFYRVHACRSGECLKLLGRGSRDKDFSGIAIEGSSRLLDHARPGEIIVSRTMHDLVVGSGLAFQELGEMKASGLPGAAVLFRGKGTSCRRRIASGNLPNS